jgi:hypothetical protein
MRGRRWPAVLLAIAVLPGGCALMGIGAPAATDAPVPVTLRAAVEPARQALLDGWPRTDPVQFRFVEARCGIGAMVVLVFEQRVASSRPTMALALSEDVAKGILLGSWVERYDVPDPDADPGLQRLIGGREIPCP